jgi:hypothetical protein
VQLALLLLLVNLVTLQQLLLAETREIIVKITLVP